MLTTSPVSIFQTRAGGTNNGTNILTHRKISRDPEAEALGLRPDSRRALPARPPFSGWTLFPQDLAPHVPLLQFRKEKVIALGLGKRLSSPRRCNGWRSCLPVPSTSARHPVGVPPPVSRAGPMVSRDQNHVVKTFFLWQSNTFYFSNKLE